MSDELLGKEIQGRYKITGILGQGGMGIVYQAEDLRLNHRPCAIKLLKGHTTDPLEAKRFEGELQIISRLRSTNVVQVLDTGRMPDHRLYIVMELLDGEPLSHFLKREGALVPIRAIQIIKGILAALSEAHEFGIIHRDLKPANIFITKARTGDEISKVLDFGIAKDTNNDESMGLTSASMIIGTPKYMAPEQFAKAPTDSRTDLYAVGLLFYQLLTGRPPFLPEDPEVPQNLAGMPAEFKIGWLHLNAIPARRNISDSLWHLIESLIAKNAEDRLPNAQVVIEKLNQALQEITGFNGTFSTGMFGSINTATPIPNSAQTNPPSNPSHPSKPFQNLQAQAVNQAQIAQQAIPQIAQSNPVAQKQQVQQSTSHTPNQLNHQSQQQLQSLSQQTESTMGISYDQSLIQQTKHQGKIPKIAIAWMSAVVVLTGLITVFYFSKNNKPKKSNLITNNCIHTFNILPADATPLTVKQLNAPSHNINVNTNGAHIEVIRSCDLNAELEISSASATRKFKSQIVNSKGVVEGKVEEIITLIPDLSEVLENSDSKTNPMENKKNKDKNKTDKSDNTSKTEKQDKSNKPPVNLNQSIKNKKTKGESAQESKEPKEEPQEPKALQEETKKQQTETPKVSVPEL
jgi:serine/threonine protein kinase